MKKLLIIEDDGDTLEMLGYFASNFDYEVVLKPEIISVEEVQQLDPSLILLDHWVHGKEGGKFCAQLKSDPLTNHIPVVLMSATSKLGEIAVDAGADWALVKPFDFDEVQSVFENYLRH